MSPYECQHILQDSNLNFHFKILNLHYAIVRIWVSCLSAEGKTTRHQMINDIILRSLSAAGVPSIKEPPDTSKLNGKRPDGITIVPWKLGKSLKWDVTVADTYAPSYLDGTVHTQGWAAEAAAKRKLQMYAALANTCHFIQVALESMEGLCAVGQDFVSAVGTRITQISGDPRSTDFQRHLLSVAIQRVNAACVLSSCTRFIYIVTIVVAFRTDQCVKPEKSSNMVVLLL